MCRRTLLPGTVLIAFGAGLLLGALLEGGLCCVLLGVVLSMAGILIVQQC